MIKDKFMSKYREKLNVTDRYNLFKEIYGNKAFTESYIYDGKYNQNEISWICKARYEFIHISK